MCRFRYDHGDQLLRTAYDNDTVERDRLKYGKRNIACSGRAVYEHIFLIVPDHVCPKLLYNSCNDRPSPNNGSVLGLKEEVYRHNVDTCR